LSYELIVWSTQEPRLGDILADPWRLDGDTRAIYDCPRWQVAVHVCSAEPEDSDERVTDQLPGIAWQTQIHISPINGPASAFSLAKRVAVSIARSAHGAIEDPQRETVRLPTGVTRIQRVPRPAGLGAILEMNWWLDHDLMRSSAGIEQFLTALKRTIPEAFPRRYGLFEPPQHSVDRDGEDHLRRFAVENVDDFVVYYTKWPVLGLTFASRFLAGINRRRFYNPNHVEVSFDASILEQPGWRVALGRFWRTLSIHLRPFYGDVRTLSGYKINKRGTGYWVGAEAENHPGGGIWQGIPRELPHAAVLGEPYVDLWPAFVQHAQCVEELAFIETENWAPSSSIHDIVGPVPRAIVRPRSYGWLEKEKGVWTLGGDTPEYPEIFPFLAPKSPDS
jgi:hypothetical protein